MVPYIVLGGWFLIGAICASTLFRPALTEHRVPRAVAVTVAWPYLLVQAAIFYIQGRRNAPEDA
jgi:hypothetical protein